MGTSTPFLKPTKRFLFPTVTYDVDDKLTLFMGGSGICALLKDGSEHLVINLNQGAAAQAFKNYLVQRGVHRDEVLALCSPVADFSAGLALYEKPAAVYVGGGGAALLGLATNREVGSERVVEVAGERVRLIPLGNIATGSDMAIFLESRSILFTGPLFFNHLHPVLHRDSVDARAWASVFEELVGRLRPKLIVPAEGDLDDGAGAREFMAYLRDLTDSTVEFADCRRRYDWPEIPGYTSLEENFDLLRAQVKSHTTLR